MTDEENSEQQHARSLLSCGKSDEDVESLTGLTLGQIVGLRAEAAVQPAPDRAKGMIKSRA